MPVNPNQPEPGGAVRLIFEYEGDQVRLVSQQAVDMAVTGFDIARTEIPGYYIDARDSKGQTLARVPARDAFAASHEVFPEKHGQPIVRVDVPHPKGAFTVVVPAPQGASHVSVVRVAPGLPAAPALAGRTTSPQEGAPSVTEIAKFPLQINAGKGGQP